MRQFLILLALVAVSSAQMLVDLKTLQGGNVKNPISGTGTFAVYVSANADSSQLLSKIMLYSNNAPISMNELKNKKLLTNSGQLQPFAVTGDVYVTTDLTQNQLNTLTGFMFVSSSAQLNNVNFYVIDMSQSTAVTLKSLDSATVLFMNSNINSNKPDQSTTISGWNQNPNSLAYLYQGFPTDAQEQKNTQIFSNPMQIDNVDQYFPNVEKFSLNLGTFYLKTFKGGVNFNVLPGNAIVDGTTTTAYTTTGFYMKQINQPDGMVSIKTKRDTAYQGSVGANIFGSVPSGGQVEVGEYGDSEESSFSIPAQPFVIPWSYPHIGPTFRISSTRCQAGEYFVQYFVLQKAKNTGTTNSNSVRTSTARNNVPTLGPNNPTSRPWPGNLETTTKSSGAVQFFASILILVVRFL